jgi:hypothetical protein
MTATTIPCPDQRRATHRARPEGVYRLVLVVGMALSSWARSRADHKAMTRKPTPLAELSDHERMQLYREATELRDGAYASRALYHVIS